MRSSVRALLALPLFAALAACRPGSSGDLTDPHVVAADLKGSWSEPASFPGISTIFQLAVVDTTVSGTGTYSIEAGRSGTLTVTGVISGTQVTLDLLRDYGSLTHFWGHLTASDRLDGYATYTSPLGNDPAPLSFQRTAR
jgi:hypothetical protein